jgi:RNA-binding protein YlmH
MSDEDILLKKRFIELAKKSEEHSYFAFSDFLGLAEQSIFTEAKASFGRARYTVFGGAVGCERVMVRFGDPEDLGYEEPFPIAILKIEPKAAKFADKLTHRDFLGSLMNLGIERSTLGDIVIRDNVGYLFCKEDIAEYIMASLERVKNTDVRLYIAADLPDGELFRTETVKIQLSG